jgi:hypothetical protein
VVDSVLQGYLPPTAKLKIKKTKMKNKSLTIRKRYMTKRRRYNKNFYAIATLIIIFGSLFTWIGLEAQALVKQQPVIEPVVITKVETIPEMITRYAIENNVDPATALHIAQCESNFNPLAKNKNSSATGVFQWIIGSWKYYSNIYWQDTTDYRLNSEKNIELAMLVMRDKGFGDWNASKHCWNK